MLSLQCIFSGHKRVSCQQILNVIQYGGREELHLLVARATQVLSGSHSVVISLLHSEGAYVHWKYACYVCAEILRTGNARIMT